jgi:hypothetical protein
MNQNNLFVPIVKYINTSVRVCGRNLIVLEKSYKKQNTKRGKYITYNALQNIVNNLYLDIYEMGDLFNTTFKQDKFNPNTIKKYDDFMKLRNKIIVHRYVVCKMLWPLLE